MSQEYLVELGVCYFLEERVKLATKNDTESDWKDWYTLLTTLQ